MSVSERRARSRCPICQGPTRDVNGEERCRNSLCSYNHQKEQCPRCQHPGPEATKFDNTGFHYFCSECHNKWTKAASGS
jgi:hypothetical protein